MLQILSCLTLMFTLCLSTFAQTTRPVSEIERVYIISIDGLRPDLLLRAQTPNLRRLMREGSFTMWANTTDVAVTLPSHVSMTTGVNPEKHGVTWNDARPEAELTYPTSPTLFELAHVRGMKTAMVAGKAKFNAMSPPDSLDYVFVPSDTIDDPAVAREAAEVIHQHQPDVMLIHFPGPDSVGHANGWGSDLQIASIERADRCVGQILNAMDESKIYELTAIIVSADHGGMGYSHGGLDVRSRSIPWIIRGPGIIPNYDLTIFPALVVNTTDTFATACYLLGIPVDYPIDGKPIREMLENRELLETPADQQAAE